jgi:hypothetical protein
VGRSLDTYLTGGRKYIAGLRFVVWVYVIIITQFGLRTGYPPYTGID